MTLRTKMLIHVSLIKKMLEFMKESVTCLFFSAVHTDKKRKRNFPHIEGNSDWIGCKGIYEEGLPNI
jgi:hypothetical protein